MGRRLEGSRRMKGVAQVLMGVVVLLASTARADLILNGHGTITVGSATNDVWATVDFHLSGNTLTVTLTANATDTGTTIQAAVLSGLGFNAPTLASSLPSSSGSAAIAAGSAKVVSSGGTLDTHTIGQEWQYKPGTGLGAAGLTGTFGPNGNLCGTAGCGVNLDGTDFGLVPTNTTLSSDGLKNNTYIQNSAVFTLILPTGSDFSLDHIGPVNLFYGSLPEGTFRAPEPSTLMLLGSGLVGFAYLAVRRRRGSAS
jgi:hypothetical protein